MVSRAKKPLWHRTSFKMAASVIAVAGIFFVWKAPFLKSNIERGMVALNQAQGNQRLIQSRVSGLNYAPMIVLRTNQEGLSDRQARNYCERVLLDECHERGDAASYHALGRLYLVERKFSEARAQFEKAAAQNTKNPQLHSDMGAALMELGEASDQTRRLQYLAEALQNLNVALELNPSLPEALFNRALVFEAMKLVPQAKEGWRAYLEIDSSSQWQREAADRLTQLEADEKKALLKKVDLYDAYLAGYRTKDRDAAWVALKQSRSRSGNYIVEKLQDEFLSATISGKASEASAALDQLTFAGETENRYVGDRYTLDLARFYQDLHPKRSRQIANARKLTSMGREEYDRSEFEASISLFTDAKRLFADNGDETEALFAESWIGYNELRIGRKSSKQRFERLSETYAQRNYESLLAQSLHATSDALTIVEELSKVLDYAGEGLKKAEEIEDDSARLRCLQQFVSMNLRFGNYQESLAHAMKALELAPKFAIEPKLIWTFYQELAKAFSLLNLFAASVEFQREALRLAGVAQWPLNIVRSFTQLGIIQQRRGDLPAAIHAASHALAGGQKIADEKSRLSVISHAHLRLGHIYTDAGDFEQALNNYDQALEMFGKLGFGTFLYEARKGKFIAYLRAGKIAEADAELATSLDLFEEYRKKIREERNRNAFFDAGHDIYDLAIDFALTKLNDKVRAFNYAEESRARALLDLIHTTPQLKDKGQGPDVEMQPGVRPQALSQFHKSIPAGVTILEYALLSDKLVIWVLTRDTLDYKATPISADQLQQQILSFLKSLEPNGDPADVRVGALKLYELLLGPVEDYLKHTEELCIVPDKGLFHVPFAALISPNSQKYLVETHRLVVSPSTNVFMWCTEEALRKARPNGESVLSVGNPKFSRRDHPELADLPSAAREAREVAAAYGSAPLLGSLARERQVRARMPEADVIHFAAHYVVNERTPMLSELLLSHEAANGQMLHEEDGSLQAYEIYEMKLKRTRLAVLSACQTGLDRAYRGEGAIGIARSFISAGVPLVVASLWPVDSDATASLMIRFHEYRKLQGYSAAEALRKAQRDMLSAADPKLQNPFAWASFTVVGGHASF